ncbi:restriction endonuclease subunit S [Pseudomonas sp. MIL19]|uniref:restriction endonuclease subunit S n=1 Tax=Pseudomonas sp. MIL19 TaxID=2976979 RepID=UPI0023643F51|nr:restriction endonuclease subunit S [Pseudomonas sp. MIL19]MDD2161409.1 restriction endonuclease subunit S [Pseudomonas sp. MIL19]
MSAVKTESYAAHEDCGDGFSKHWQVCRLKDKAAFNPSKTEIKELPRECTFAPMEKLKKDSLLTDVTTITSDISGSYTYFREGDILVAKVTPCFENRNIAIAKNLTHGIGFGSSEINVVRVSKKENPRWFFYLFLTSSFIEAGASKMAGAGGLKRIPSLFLETFCFALPPLVEQTAIAAYLDTKTAKIDSQIDLLGQKATQYGKLKQSLINEAVTRGLDKSVPMKDSYVVWIGAVPEHWDVRRGKDIFEQTRNKAGLDSSSYDVLSLTLNGVIKRDLDNMKGKIPASFDGYQIANPGDLVLCLFDIDVTPRIVGHVNNLGIITSAYTVIKGKKNVDMKYFLYYYLEQNRNGSLLANSKTLRSTMTFDLFSQLLLPVPPLEEQRAIASYLDEKTAQIDRIVTAINTQIDKLKDLRKALINDVVTGKIKVLSEGLAV